MLERTVLSPVHVGGESGVVHEGETATVADDGDVARGVGDDGARRVRPDPQQAGV